MKKINPQLSLKQVKEILQPQFEIEYLAKSYGEPLWLHSFSVWSILSKLVAYIPRFTIREKLLMELAALLHDIGKMRFESQLILAKTRGGTLKHTATKDEIRNYLSPFISSGLLNLTEEEINSTWEFALHHHLSEEQLKEANMPAFGIYAEIVRFADWLSSMEHLDISTITRIAETLQDVCQVTAFGVGRYPSPSTYYILQKAIEKYRNLSWHVLLILDDGAIFIGDVNARLPSKKEIVENFINFFIKQSFEGHSIQVRFLRYELLSGRAAEKPQTFLQARKEFFTEKLGNVEEGPILFFRTLIDLYKKSGKLTNKLRKQLPILDILAMAGGTSGIKKAKNAWNKSRKNQTQWTATNEFIGNIFNNVSLSDVLQNINESEKSRRLRDMTAEELFNVLLKIASDWFKSEEDSNLQEIVEPLISMEEEINFEEIAGEALERYKNYKRSRKPTKALCEQCGATIPVVATSSLNFPTRTAWTGFTQINPNPDSGAPRVVCPLCVFDATMLRSRDLGPNRSPVYARVSSRIPELWWLYKDLQTYITRLNQSMTNPQEIKDFSETEFAGLPLPPKFEIPIRKKYKDISFEVPIQTERGTLFPLDMTSVNTSPKDLRAKYLALYALLNLMGLETHIGLEEQEGLFGEKIFEKGAVDWQTLYYEGLVIAILAMNIRERKQNKYIFAQNLLKKSPSRILSKLEEAKIKKELFEKIILFLLRINIKHFSERGEQGGRSFKRRQIFRRRDT
jgi:hypothetical protein